MALRSLPLLLCVPLICLLAGCAAEDSPPAADPAPESSSSAESENGTAEEQPDASASDPPAKPAEVELITASNEELQQLIAEQRGKIVIVDFWATWCINCMELMPHTAQLQREHADELALITVAIDDADRKPQAKEFLGEYDLSDGVPHYKFYDREGNLVKVLDTDLERLATEESIDAAVTELLSAE